MNKLIVGSLFLLCAGSVASASLFGPFGPFGQPALPGYGGAAGLFPGRPAFGQLPFYPANPYLPVGAATLPALPAGLGRALPGVAPAPAVPVLPAAATGSLRSVAGNSDVLGRLALADLPEDLQQRAEELQLASQAGFDACEELLQVPGAFWQYKRCNAAQLRNVLTAAKALEQEATARATAAAAATEAAAAATESSDVPAA
uniref:Uncharacterized protein n=1 Tax=Anopheles atroparvus TaxID=41427 RepID=A0A182JHL0_ANOAO